MSKYLDLAGLTAYDGKIKEWIKSSVVDITDDAINALFVTAAEGPADNEIWYTTVDGNLINWDYEMWNNTPSDFKFGGNVISNTYENGVGKLVFENTITSIESNPTDNPSWFSPRLVGNSINSVILPNSVEIINGYSFFGVPLNSFEVPQNVTRIGGCAFEGCLLTSFILNNKIEEIGADTFASCEQLSVIDFKGTVEEWNSKNIRMYYPENCDIRCINGTVKLQNPE
jgi:hypothetical protein